MPNLTVAYNEGMTVGCAGPHVDDADLRLAHRQVDALGELIVDRRKHFTASVRLFLAQVLLIYTC